MGDILSKYNNRPVIRYYELNIISIIMFWPAGCLNIYDDSPLVLRNPC